MWEAYMMIRRTHIEAILYMIFIILVFMNFFFEPPALLENASIASKI